MRRAKTGCRVAKTVAFAARERRVATPVKTFFHRSYPRVLRPPYPVLTRITEGAHLETVLMSGAGAVSGARVSQETRGFLGLPPGYGRRPVPKFGVSDASEGGWRKTAAYER
jgi:hypothetical protein